MKDGLLIFLGCLLHQAYYSTLLSVQTCSLTSTTRATMQHTNSRQRLTHEKFIVTLATDLLMSAGHSTAISPTAVHLSSRQPIACLVERHFLSEIGRMDEGHAKQSDCAICNKRKGSGRKTTIYKCRQCNLRMWVVPCFELHHTKRNPERYL